MTKKILKQRKGCINLYSIRQCLTAATMQIRCAHFSFLLLFAIIKRRFNNNDLKKKVS